MGNQKTSGLAKRCGIWHIDKQFRGVRIRESAATSDLTEAVALLAKRIEAIRKAQFYGVRPERTFRAAATKYLQENQQKRSIGDDGSHLAILDPFIGDMFLSGVYMEKLQPFIDKRRKDGDKVKNTEDRLIVLNRIARSVIEEARGMHPEYVFVRRKKDGHTSRLTKMYGTAWRSARERAANAWERAHATVAPTGFRCVRVHDLKHTFGRRLRAAGVSFEDRQDLLGHKSRRMTTHYSEAELANLIAAAERACSSKSHKIPASSWATSALGTEVEANSLM
jgi:hypothetical protein